jgi:hypothetical protein
MTARMPDPYRERAPRRKRGYATEMIAPVVAALLAVAPTWSYRLTGADSGVLRVEARFGPGAATVLSVEPGGARFISEVTVRDGARTQTLEHVGEGWSRPACPRDCTVSYRFHWRDAAAQLRDVDAAALLDGALEAAPSSFLLRPQAAAPGTRYRIESALAEPLHFECGLPHPADAPDAFEGRVSALAMAPYAVLSSVQTTRFEVDGGEVTLLRLAGKLSMDDAAIARWAMASARGVQNYFGRFPTTRVLLVIVPVEGGLSGKTLASDGATILLNVGAQMPAAAIAQDWVLTHEMVHLAWPRLSRNLLWLDEGLATYVEPLARLSVGLQTEEQLWVELVDGLPQGLPHAGEGGLDGTARWGRLYWGGARFFLLADLAFRRQTHGARGLRDALVAIVAANREHALEGDLAATLHAGDAAAGASVLGRLHDRLGATDESIDLDALFKRLGIRRSASGVHLEEDAPEAPLRRAITRTLRPAALAPRSGP